MHVSMNKQLISSQNSFDRRRLEDVSCAMSPLPTYRSVACNKLPASYGWSGPALEYYCTWRIGWWVDP